MSRRCEVCFLECGKNRPLKPGVYHLHELQEGERFHIGGELSRLLSKSGGRCEIEDPEPGKQVEFETFMGDEISFQRNGATSRPCSPYAQVRPLRTERHTLVMTPIQ